MYALVKSCKSFIVGRMRRRIFKFAICQTRQIPLPMQLVGIHSNKLFGVLWRLRLFEQPIFISSLLAVSTDIMITIATSLGISDDVSWSSSSILGIIWGFEGEFLPLATSWLQTKRANTSHSELGIISSKHSERSRQAQIHVAKANDISHAGNETIKAVQILVLKVHCIYILKDRLLSSWHRTYSWPACATVSRGRIVVYENWVFSTITH